MRKERKLVVVLLSTTTQQQVIPSRFHITESNNSFQTISPKTVLVNFSNFINRSREESKMLSKEEFMNHFAQFKSSEERMDFLVSEGYQPDQSESLSVEILDKIAGGRNDIHNPDPKDPCWFCITYHVPCRGEACPDY